MRMVVYLHTAAGAAIACVVREYPARIKVRLCQLEAKIAAACRQQSLQAEETVLAAARHSDLVPLSAARSHGTARFGASLKCLEEIGQTKGMSLVGCDIAGVNAFFVRAGLAPGRFLAPFDAKTHWEPPRYHLAFRRGHPVAR